jgi:hypothetical protein
MSRRTDAALHHRTRVRDTAGSVATVYRKGVALFSDITVTKVRADRAVTADGEFLLSSGEHAWIVGTDTISDALQMGDVFKIGNERFHVVEGVATQEFWNWYDNERTARTYVTRLKYGDGS